MENVLSAIIPVLHAWVLPTINAKLVPPGDHSKMELVSYVTQLVPSVRELVQLTVQLAVQESL